MSIEELFNAIPILIPYIAYGATFLAVFNFVTFKRYGYSTGVYIIACVVMSYILDLSLSKISFNILKAIFGDVQEYGVAHNMIIIFLCIIVAYVAGRIFVSKWFNSLIGILGVSRTVNSIIWSDLHMDGCFVKVPMGNDKVCLGVYHLLEEGTNNPRIVLKNYYIKDAETGEVLFDCYDDDTYQIVLPTDVEWIEIIDTSAQQKTSDAN